MGVASNTNALQYYLEVFLKCRQLIINFDIYTNALYIGYNPIRNGIFNYKMAITARYRSVQIIQIYMYRLIYPQFSIRTIKFILISKRLPHGKKASSIKMA